MIRPVKVYRGRVVKRHPRLYSQDACHSTHQEVDIHTMFLVISSIEVFQETSLPPNILKTKPTYCVTPVLSVIEQLGIRDLLDADILSRGVWQGVSIDTICPPIPYAPTILCSAFITTPTTMIAFDKRNRTAIIVEH